MGTVKVEIFHNNESVTAWDFPVGSDASITIEVDGAPWAGATFTDDDALALGYWTGLEAEWVEVLRRRRVPRAEAEAKALGWDVDKSTYPWVAYKGERFSPEFIVNIFTPAYTPQ